MGLLSDGNTERVVLVLSHDYALDDLLDEVKKLVMSSKARRLTFYVISPDGRPKYFRKLRPMISSIISTSFTVVYGGYTAEDLRRLLKSIDGGVMAAIIAGSNDEFKEILERSGINYKVLG